MNAVKALIDDRIRKLRCAIENREHEVDSAETSASCGRADIRDMQDEIAELEAAADGLDQMVTLPAQWGKHTGTFEGRPEPA